jgi:hypothetical protein
LIYFIFRDDTYVVSPVFTCLIIVGGFAAGVRILLEKDCQDTIFRKIRKILEKYQKLYFAERLRKPEGGGERSQGVGSHVGGVAWPLATPAYCVATLAHFRSHPCAYFIVPENLSQGRFRDRDR